MTVVTFYSYKGGTGRTMALANTAWILASAGNSVLMIDWDLESPGLHRFFHPFLEDKQLRQRSTTGLIDMIRDYAAAMLDLPGEESPVVPVDRFANVMGRVIPLSWPHFRGRGTLDLLPAGQQGPAYGKLVSSFDWANFYDRLHGGAFLRALRESARDNYDYVLIDSRTGLSDSAGICTVLMPDVLVDCFTLSSQSVDGAALVAQSVISQRAPGKPLRVLPVPMRIEDAEQMKLEAGRDYARQRFESFLAEWSPDRVTKYWGEVEIPYRPYYAYEEILATFGDRPYQEGSLLSAFERLTRYITDGRVEHFEAVDDRLRRRWLAEFERPKQAAPADVLISHSAPDRVWAEWVASTLNEAGVRVTLQDIDELATADTDEQEEAQRQIGAAGKALVMLSQDYVKSGPAIQTWNALSARNGDSTGRFLVAVRLDSGRLPAPFTQVAGAVDLAGVTNEEQARDAILGRLDLPEFVAVSPRRVTDGGPRFPAIAPAVWNVPSRNAAFTGRRAILDGLREQLAGNVTVVLPQAIFGLGGVGKTQVAIEYAYRFAPYYDVVWWLTAEQPSMVPNALAELAEKLDVVSGESIREKAQSMLDALRRGIPSPRWLLILDNAGAPEELREFSIPNGPGHVIYTSRDLTWAQLASPIEIGVFQREESISFLRRRMTKLSIEEADRVASKLGDLPLAVEQAGAWLVETGMPVDQYLDLLDKQPIRVLEGNPPDSYHMSAAATWLLSLNRLREQTPAAAKLLELCAFFGPAPIPMTLINSRRFVSVLEPFNEAYLDDLVLGQVIRSVGRYALAKVDSGQAGQQPSIQLHRLVQAVIRENLPEPDRDENHRRVHEILAAANPLDPDEPKNWAAYAGLLPHLEPAEALHSTSAEVRRLIVDTVRYLWRISDYTGSQALAEQAIALWSESSGEDDLQLLSMRFQMANSIRSQAQYETAYAIDADVRERLLALVGPDHAHTIMSSSGVGADLRALGRYREARDLDEDTWNRFKEHFPADHPRTLKAANNLAVSLRLVGDLAGARELDEDTLRRSRARLGQRHPDTLITAVNLAYDLRELGEYRQAKDLLAQTVEDYREVVGGATTAALRASRSLAITLRKLGQLHDAFELSSEILERLLQLHGRNHPETLACASNLAADESALGDDSKAKGTAERALELYEQTMGENHPFTLACANSLSIFTRKLGDAAAARALSERVVRELSGSLGADHPHALTCTINLANSIFDLDHKGEAMQLCERAFLKMREAIGENHPDTIAAESNLSIMKRSLGERVGAQELLDDAITRAVTKMGESHPNTLSIRGGVRLSCDIDPPSP